MNTTLRVLMVEDLEAEANMLLRELQRGGYEVERFTYLTFHD